MTDEKAIVNRAEPIDAKNAIVEDVDCEKRSRRKRLVIVSIVLLVILICIAVSAVILISFWTAKIKLQEKEHRTVGGREVDQELYQDAVDSLTSYHIVDGTVETWFIFDYNREIIVTKVKAGTDSQGTCYVQAVDPSTITDVNSTSVSTTTPSSQGSETTGNQSTVTLRTSNRPIVEKSMLGKRGQDLCKDVDTFWILSSPGGSSGNDVRTPRVRRALYTIYGCWFDWSFCFYFSFPESPAFRYYTCRWTCGTQTINY